MAADAGLYSFLGSSSSLTAAARIQSYFYSIVYEFLPRGGPAFVVRDMSHNCFHTHE